MKGRLVALWIVVVLIGASALAFGSVEAWAEEWLRFGAIAAFAAVLWSDGPKRMFRHSSVVLLPALLLVAWGFLQSVPLPRAVVGVLSPRTSRIQRETMPAGGGAELPAFLLGQAPAREVTLEAGAKLPPGPADAGSVAARSSLSINPYATRRACLAWIAPLLLFVVAERLGRDRSARYSLVWAIGAWTGALGAIAVLQRVASNGKLLWFREMPPDAVPLGPFVNPNHFAGYVELGLLVAIGLVLAILFAGESRPGLAVVRSSLTDRAWALPRLLVLGMIGLLGLAGLAMSGCRGGELAFVCALVFFVPLGRLRAAFPVLLIVVPVVALSLGLLSWHGREEQSLQTAFFAEGTGDMSLATRSDIWGRTWKILLDHPVTGTGLGTFPSAFASYDREGEWQVTSQAHNDYLQLASETGLVGIALFGWLVVAAAWKVVRPALMPQEGQPRWTTLGLIAAVAVLVLHSVLEFNLQIPAVAALFAVVCGLLVASTSDPGPLDAGNGAS